MTGASNPDDYTPIEATLDLINDTTNYNFLPSSKSAEGNIVDEEGNLNISTYSVGKTLAKTLPFTLKIINDVKNGRIEGSPQSMISQLINPKYNKDFADKLRVVETAYKITVNDNYRSAKDLGMDDSKAFTYANVLSLAEGISETIMPDYKYFDSLTGSTLKNLFKSNLKDAATKQAVKNVTKDFFKSIALELGEEEFVLAVEDGLKYSLLLNHKNSEFFNIKRQKELIATTAIMSGAMGTVAIPGKFKKNRTDIYRDVYNNIADLQDQFAAEIKSPLTDKKTKETLYEAYKFASDIANAVAKAPETVTADQIDLLVQKNKLEEKKKNTDTAFHPDINEEIAGIDTKIRDLSKIPVVESVEEITPEVKPVEKELDNRPIPERQAEAESKIKRKDLFTGVGDFSTELGGSDKAAVPVSHNENNGIEIVEYAHPDTGSIDVIVTGKSDNDFVGFYRIYENGKPTNKWSSKFENQSRNKEDFKTMISGVQQLLPEGHEYTEKTSISTDGLRVWGQQLSRGYELQTDENGNLVTNEVAINGDSIVNELGIDVNQGNFDNISVTNNEQFQSVKKALLPYLQKFGLNESNIRNVNGTVEIDLPVLKKSTKKETTTEVNTKQPVVTAETSSNFANMTQDGEGNFVFYHVSPTTLDVIDPSKYGSNAGNVTSRDEKAAIGRVGGVAMFYTDPTDSENMVNGNKHVVKVPESEVYDFNSDPENFIDEAKRQFSEANPNMAFSPNDQFAWITKVAGDNGYKMVVGEWGKGKTRAQTTQKLTPVDVMELNGNVVTKPFEKEYVGNREKGFKSVVPQSKQSKIKEAKAAIDSFRSRAGKYDELYQAVSGSRPNMTDEEIKKLVDESDIPQELKDQYNEAMAYEPGNRRTEAPAAAYERTDDVSLDNAPEGTFLNIGLNIGTTQDLMDKDDVISMLPEGVEVLDQGVNEAISEIDGKENKELTLSVKLSRPLTDVEMAKFLVDTKQKAIPQMSESKGAMHGTKEWGDFNPEYFYMPDGSKLSDTASLTKNVDAELEALNKLFDESEQGGKVTDEQIENGKKAIENLVPDVEWVIHETNESMKSATGTTNKGEYILTRDKDGNVKREIHINKVKADGTTVAHEVFHAVLLEKVLNDADAQELTRRMMKAVAKTASPKLKIQLDEFAATYDDPNVRDEERLAQLIGILAQNYDQLSQPNKNIVKKWLDKLAKMFGLKPFTDNEVIDLLNTIAGKTAKGEAITEKDV
jgi:hypothetical protein